MKNYAIPPAVSLVAKFLTYVQDILFRFYVVIYSKLFSVVLKERYITELQNLKFTPYELWIL